MVYFLTEVPLRLIIISNYLFERVKVQVLGKRTRYVLMVRQTHLFLFPKWLK